MKKPKAQSPKLKAKSEQRTANSQQQIANSQQQIAVMLELLRSAVLDRDPVIDPSVKVDWDKLMAVSQDHGLLAWVWDGICKLPKEQQPDRQSRIGWAISTQDLWDSYDKQVSVLDEIVEKCGEKGIRVLLLKGIGLSQLYPKPQSRPSCDIDIFVFERYAESLELLSGGVTEYDGKHAMFLYKGVQIECHDHIIDTGTPLQVRIQDYINSTLVECEQTESGYWKLPLISNTIFVLLHILAHLNNPGPDPLRIRSILDYGMMLIKIENEGNSAEFKNMLQTLCLEHASDLFVRLSEWILDVDLSGFYSPTHPALADVNRAKRLLFDQNLRHPHFDNSSYFKQLYQRIMWFRSVRWRYAYLPSLERRRSFSGMQLQVHILIKAFFGLPFDVPFKKSIKGETK